MSRDYHRIAAAIRYLDDHWQVQPTLDMVAEAVGLSPFHLQRLFTDWAGISPKRFVQAITATRAKALLDRALPVLDTALDVGLSGPSRLHDLFIATEAMTPGQYKARGADLLIRAGLHDSAFGRCLVGLTPLGICALEFVDDGGGEVGDTAALARLQARFPLSRVQRADSDTVDIVSAMEQGTLSGRRLLLKGTNFQLQVWRALLAIPPGRLTTYAAVADAVCSRKAARAVGAAVGANRIGVLIPCHRVIGATGALTGYHWGTTRKQALLAWEALQADGGANPNTSNML
jgi:AraC family transcriptional regulator, regulatory protein of adaptative response / methylated-DNA-[protein]-cysteine methyltransferase